MSKEMIRPTITVNRVFEDKRSAMEAFVAVLVREMDRRKSSVRTFEPLNEPDYTCSESEVKDYDTTA
jgi:hypothetical protein